MTSLDVEEGGHGGQRHSYLFRRPRVLQYHQRGREVRYVETKTGDSVQWKRATGATPSSTAPDHSSSDDSGEGLVKQREHIDLFIDLTFVGIVSNLSEHFNTQIFYSDASETGASAPIARAMMEFVVLFISTWRLWNYLRRFVSSFFQDDIFQRFFYFWILMLVLVWGNNAPYAIGGGPGGTVALVVFLVARASFLIAEAGYSWFIPWLWPQLLLTLGLNVPAAALWIGAIRADDWLRIGLLMGALVAELVATAMIASPLLDRLLNDGRKISHDAEHYAVRLEAFFIVILGEGVMLLAKGSPLGQGISYMTGSGTMALSIFFGIYMLYFRGDYSRNYVQAMRHSWWKDSLWGFAHVILFGSLFLLDVAVLSLVINGGVYADQSDATSAATAARAVRARDSAPDSDNLLYEPRRALWTASVCLAISLSTMSFIALLNRPLIEARALMINEQRLRLLPRLAVAIVTVCLPAAPRLTGGLWIRIEFALLCVMMVWEWFAGLQRDAGFLEPADQDLLSTSLSNPRSSR